MAQDTNTGYCFVCQRRVPVMRKGINHILHLLLTMFTAGVWVIVWILTAVSRAPWRCSQCGSMQVRVGEGEVARFDSRLSNDLVQRKYRQELRYFGIAAGSVLAVLLVLSIIVQHH